MLDLFRAKLLGIEPEKFKEFQTLIRGYQLPKGGHHSTIVGSPTSWSWGRAGLSELQFTANKLLKGAGAGANPTEIAVPATVVTQIDRTDKSTATGGSWVDTDCSAEIPAGAKAAYGYMKNTGASNYAGGVRKNGATDNGTYDMVLAYSTAFFIVELDVNRIFEQNIENAAVDCFIIGYIA